MAERQGIEIDYCPKCRGVWLDRGELDKIIERSVVEQPVPAAPANTGVYEPQRGSRDYEERGARDYRDRDDRDEHYGRRKKKKSFLGEMFDFD
jgi:Zn-finger nucleic acid-binding protein